MDNFRKYGIDGLVVIGGDGMFIGVILLLKEYGILVIGILVIIDNDIVGIDYIIGYDIVLNMVVEVVDKICDIVSSYYCIFFIEVMGCDVGFIVLNVVLVFGVELVFILEEEINILKLVDEI